MVFKPQLTLQRINSQRILQTVVFHIKKLKNYLYLKKEIGWSAMGVQSGFLHIPSGNQFFVGKPKSRSTCSIANAHFLWICNANLKKTIL
jgi:hypothetical protein